MKTNVKLLLVAFLGAFALSFMTFNYANARYDFQTQNTELTSSSFESYASVKEEDDKKKKKNKKDCDKKKCDHSKCDKKGEKACASKCPHSGKTGSK